MQKVVLLFLFCFSILSLFSQKTIDTHWGNGVLKSRVKMNGLDTTYVEFYQENGNLCYQRWGKDSLFVKFNKDKSTKAFYNKRKKMQFNIHALDADSVASYNSRGEITYSGFYKDDKTVFSKEFKKGQLLSNKIQYWYSPSIFRIEDKFWDGKMRYSYTNDTLTGIYVDSLFYFNGKLKSVIKSNRAIYMDEITCFDTLGNTSFFYKKDTIKLLIIKDNIECLYGFKNKKDEWVIKPQYESINYINNNKNFLVAHTDGKYNVLDMDGKPVFSKKLDFVEIIYKTSTQMSYFKNTYSRNPDEYYHNDSEGIISQEEYNLKYQSDLLRCRKGNKYGVVNCQGETVLDYKYDDIKNYYKYVFQVRIGKKWGIANAKGDIIVKPLHNDILITHTPQYFIVIDSSDTLKNDFSYGLVDNKGNEVLPIIYSNISPLDTSDNKFKVTIKGSIIEINNLRSRPFGIFDADKKTWELDTTFIEKGDPYKVPRIVEKINPISKKVDGLGLFDDKYSTTLPFEYEKIELYSESNNAYSFEYNGDKDFTNEFVITKKNNKCGLFNLDKKKWALEQIYDTIQVIYVTSKSNDGLILTNNEKNIETEVFRQLEYYGIGLKFLAVKKDNKWQLVYGNNENLIKDSFDYISEQSINLGFKCNHLRLIKNNKSEILTAESYPLFSSLDKIEKSNNSIYSITDLQGKNLILNRKNEVIVPPQYKTVFIAQDYILAFDTLLKKRKIINFDGSSKEFLTQFKVLETHIDKGYSIVENPKTKLLGLVNNDGKAIIPCAYFSIATSKENDIIFVKKQAPNVPSDSIIIIHENHKSAFDAEWQMFDSKGKQVSKSYFDYPFLFYKGVGTSKVNDKYGIWQIDGKMLLPPQYEKIIMDTSQQIFYLFKRWSDSSLAIGFADMKGRIIQEPKLDKMSRFFGDYALGFTGGKHIVINKKGEYVVPPFANSLLNYKGSIYDSLWKINVPIVEVYNSKKEEEEQMLKATGDLYFDMRLKFKPPFKADFAKKIDSLDTSKKAQLLNFVIEKTAMGQYMNTSIIKFQRHDGETHTSSNFKNEILDRIFLTEKIYKGEYLYYNNSGLNATEKRELVKFNISDRYISVAVFGEIDSIKTNLLNDEMKKYSSIKKLIFYNIVKGENGWENIESEDILNINADNSLKLNELLIQKIKALKNEEIDCSNPLRYFEETKNLVYLKDEGLVFYLFRNIQEDSHFKDRSNYVPLLLTWEELKPFLKKKP
jgi:WG containing repeat